MLVDLFPNRKESPAVLKFEKPKLDEGFGTASTVNYVGKGINLYKLGYKYTGRFDVLKAILNTSYLWENIRMQGGAYGCSASFDFYSGDFSIVSYRDPNLKETLNSYDNIADFINIKRHGIKNNIKH